MVAATVFFLMESTAVSGHWKTSMNVGALVTLVAAVHYFYMREFWVLIHTSPILYRYIDWTITVPLQMIEFYLILSAVSNKITQGSFWKLLIGTVVMLVFGYTGEAHLCPAVPGWASLVACADGSSSSSRSSVARPDLLLVSLDQPTSSPRPHSAPCVLLSLQVGPFTQPATSLATSWVVSTTAA